MHTLNNKNKQDSKIRLIPVIKFMYLKKVDYVTVKSGL
jgi:hypothetical protein